MQERGVHPKQVDAIREVVNIGAGHAATALSTMTNVTVMISVPRVTWTARETTTPETLPGRGALVVISVEVQPPQSRNREKASLVIGRETALRMVGLLLRREVELDAELGPVERSTLQELGNIVCASYVGVLGQFLGESVMIGTPTLREATREDVSAELAAGLMVETDFTLMDSTFEGMFVLTHSEVSFATLLQALGLGEIG